MSDRKYKYIKYEKLSDAVRAFEEGEQLYYKNEFGEFAFVKNSVEQFWTHGEYYHREEVELFECWVIVNTKSKYLHIVSAGREDFVKDHKIAYYPDEAYQVIKLREVIEG